MAKTYRIPPSGSEHKRGRTVQGGNTGAQPTGGDLSHTQHGSLQYDRRSFTTGKPVQGSSSGNAGVTGQLPSRAPMVNKKARDR